VAVSVELMIDVLKRDPRAQVVACRDPAARMKTIE